MPVANSCAPPRRYACTPSTYIAPSRAPGSDPSPPMTTIVNTCRLATATLRNVSSSLAGCCSVKVATSGRVSCFFRK